MSFITSYADKLAQKIEQMLGATEHASTQPDVKDWFKRVVELTWTNQPQNVYNLIALACALFFIFFGLNYLQRHM